MLFLSQMVGALPDLMKKPGTTRTQEGTDMTAEPTYLKPPRSPETSTRPPARDVFFDPTGRRWRLVKATFILIAAIFVITATVSWTPMRQPPGLAHGRRDLPPVTIPDQGRTPVIGVGPLVRLVAVVKQGNSLIAVDPITHTPLSTITGDDALLTGSSRYVIQHYGYSSAAHKTIELTFDDGPDPTWTPKILNLLSKYKAAATFFVIGSEVVKFPDIVNREAREGHTVANHTLTHPELTPDQVQQQFVSTDRIIRSTTGIATNLVRLPYDSNAGKVADADANAVMIHAARLNYIVSTEEFDTSDWKYGDPETRPKTSIPFPPTTMDNITILLHDGGGNRSETLAYLERLLPWGIAHGYSFHSLPQVSPQVMSGISHITPSVWDRETEWMYAALFSWPNAMIRMLFVMAVVSVIIGSGVNILLAIARRFRVRRRFANYTEKAAIRVSIVIAAYNEEKVIRRTLEAIGHSRYANIHEIIVVDDGSTDNTAGVVEEIARSEPRIRLMRQENTGKATALNRAFIHARAPIVVTLDADTIFTPTTVGNLVRHFALDKTGRLAAVAGVVKVGNLRNVLTRWQALEYITMINIDRGAQDILHAITVAPGACAAWRRRAVIRVGGYSRSTLAEDCDLALELQQARFGVTQDDEAICYTEAPETVRALARQRYRWMYGSIQAMWKHRKMIFNPRYGWLGMLSLPLSVVSVVMPVVFLPFVYIMAVVTFESQGITLLLLYAALFIVAQLLSAIVGVCLARERPTHLLIAPIYRLIYEPLRAYILYRSALTVLRGARIGWNKLQRTGTVAMPAQERRETVESVAG